MATKLQAGSRITRIVVTGTGGSDATMAFFVDNGRTADVTLNVKVGANGMSAASCGVGTTCSGDKKTPRGTYTLGSGGGRWNPPSQTVQIANTADGRQVSMGLAVFSIISQRQIYIHGTRNDPREPTSGCIRMRNDDIIVIGRYLTRGITVQIN